MYFTWEIHGAVSSSEIRFTLGFLFLFNPCDRYGRFYDLTVRFICAFTVTGQPFRSTPLHLKIYLSGRMDRKALKVDRVPELETRTVQTSNVKSLNSPFRRCFSTGKGRIQRYSHRARDRERERQKNRKRQTKRNRSVSKYCRTKLLMYLSPLCKCEGIWYSSITVIEPISIRI